jgi:hypothetical protein
VVACGARRRGRIAAVHPSSFCDAEVEGTIVRLDATHLQNYSKAARKAWERMPVRNGGRPFGSKVSDRISVTVRLDRNLLERLKLAATIGTISDRTEFLNEVIEGALSTLGRRAKSIMSPERITPEQRALIFGSSLKDIIGQQ